MNLTGNRAREETRNRGGSPSGGKPRPCAFHDSRAFPSPYSRCNITYIIRRRDGGPERGSNAFSTAESSCFRAIVPIISAMKAPLILTVLLPGVVVFFASCQGSGDTPVVPNPPERVVPVGSSPQSVRANWKERLEQPYVFLEHRGDYRSLGETMRKVLAIAGESGLDADGPPFALFYDDPGRTPVEELRSRACLPVNRGPGADVPLSYEVLPQAMVAYGVVPGPYDQAPRAYPALFQFLDDHHWQRRGPLREIYLVNPAEVESFSELVCEVQIPWISGG